MEGDIIPNNCESSLGVIKYVKVKRRGVTTVLTMRDLSFIPVDVGLREERLFWTLIRKQPRKADRAYFGTILARAGMPTHPRLQWNPVGL